MNCKYKSSMAKKRAFTLIELLIVIAIIGILFIVLVSKVDFATDKAKATGVQTDFRSFQMALETVSKEKAGFNSFGWNTGDANANGVRDSVDEGDANEDGVYQDGETWTGHKKYLETWTNTYSLIRPGTTFADVGYDKDAIFALETAINKNLDPTLHITIDSKTGLITMANGAQDPWNTQYHGAYISAEDGMDRGAIVMYSNGANQKFGSEHAIANGVPTVIVPGNNKNGADDYSMVVVYTYTNGFGEVGNLTTGFSNNQMFLSGNGVNGNHDINNGEVENDNVEDGIINLDAGLYDKNNNQVAAWDELVNTYGLNISKQYNAESALSETTSLYYIMQHNASLSSGVKLVVKNGVTAIGEYALYNCNKLTHLTIPNSVAAIGVHSLEGCNGLVTLSIPFAGRMMNSTPAASYASNYLSALFGSSDYSDGNNFVPSSLRKVWITGSGAVSNNAFYGLTNIQEIVLSDDIIGFGQYAFYNCTSLSKINMPENGTYLGACAFYNCPIENSFVIPDGISSIGVSAFYNCNKLTNITLPDSITTINEKAFANCENLQSINIPKNMSRIYKDAFLNCENLSVVQISDINAWCNVLFSNDAAMPMYYAEQLLLNGNAITGEVIVPNNVSTLYSYLFKNCTQITSFIVPNSVTTIKHSVLAGCTNITTLQVPYAGIRENTGVAVSYGSNYLSSFFGLVAYDNAQDYIPTSLKQVCITGSGVISQNAFYGFANLEEIVLSNNNTGIGQNAFYGCTGIEHLTIPSSVTAIAASAFASTNLKSITFAGTMEQWNSINKANKWDDGLTIVEIVCSDGSVTLE